MGWGDTVAGSRPLSDREDHSNKHQGQKGSRAFAAERPHWRISLTRAHEPVLSSRAPAGICVPTPSQELCWERIRMPRFRQGRLELQGPCSLTRSGRFM